MPTKQMFNEITTILLEGKTILYPTDTIWGLGCDATNIEAIERIYELKKRPLQKSFIVFFPDIEMLEKYLLEPEKNLNYLIEKNKPTTFIVDYKLNLPKILASFEGTFAIRIPKNELCIQIMKQLNKPIVSTSANISGDISPKVFHEISNQILKQVDFIIPEIYDNGTGEASKIIKIENGIENILR